MFFMVRFLCAQWLLADENIRFRALLSDAAKLELWYIKWLQRMERYGINRVDMHGSMRSINPAFSPHQYGGEQAIRAADDQNDSALTHQLIKVLQNPFDEQAEKLQFMEPPQPDEVVRQTFCRT